MIPVRLQLRNFMCYRDDVPPLLFDGIHVACLCGENGAGKSALLDAITWALWGKSRVQSSDDELIHQGRDEMEVELEFQVAESRYRVVRKRQRGAGKKSGKPLLDLFASTGNGFRAISGNSARETQQKIVDLLRMDYQTFINSAFLVQGHADEFTVKSPDRRKEVLGEILGLRDYDRLEERAREEARKRRTDGQALQMRVLELTAELARRPEYQEAVRAIGAELRAREEELRKADASLQEIRRARDELELDQRHLNELKLRLDSLKREAGRRREQEHRLRQTIARLSETLAGAVAIEQGYAQLHEARRRKDTLDTAARAYLELAERKAVLERAIERRKAALAAERSALETRAQELQRRIDEAARSALSLAQAREALATLAALDQQAAQRRSKADALQAQAAELRAANELLRREMEEIKTSMERLRAGQGVCPLCGTELGQDRCQNALADYQARGEAKAREHRASQARIKTLDEAEAHERREAKEAEARVRSERPKRQAQVAELEHAAAEASRAGQELPAAKARLSEIDDLLAKTGFASDEEAALSKLAERIQALDYDRAAHERATTEYRSLEPFEERHRQLMGAAQELPEAQQRQQGAEEDLRRAEGEAAGLDTQAMGLAKKVKALPEVARATAALEQTRSEAVQAVDRLRQRLGAAQRDLDRLAEVEQRLSDSRAAEARAADEQGVYEELTRAFGRRGLQALIIESVIPDIEDEANRLLARLTDNRMHLKFETQIAYRAKEGFKETLEIMLSDELGTRSYETFSGGEAFRINLALRIALSRLLARRAGAPLPTLFIDEGFGTQDPAGRDKIVEAINAIRDDFERIIVITHIDELKEQFPARIEVEKTPSGSTFRLA